MDPKTKRVLGASALGAFAIAAGYFLGRRTGPSRPTVEIGPPRRRRRHDDNERGEYGRKKHKKRRKHHEHHGDHGGREGHGDHGGWGHGDY